MTEKSKFMGVASSPQSTDAPHDHFERLVNIPGTGPIDEIATTMDAITHIRGFMADLDPYDLREGGPLDVQPGLTPTEFYERCLRDRLQRSSFWKNAEVICTGNGLALVHRLNEPLVCKSEIDVRHFDLQLKIIHTSLPSDPDQGGVCMMPRVPGSVNTKHGDYRPVVQLAQGTPITHQQFVEFAERMIADPMTVILETLFGGTRIKPCPICRQDGSSLMPVQKGRFVKCKKCEKYSMGDFYRTILKDDDTINQLTTKEVHHEFIN